MPATSQAIATTDTMDSSLDTILEGYRFYVAEDPETFARALDVRRQVYVENFGYDVPVPDEYDHRSWLLVAEHVATGEIIGTMRMTPRMLGPVEAEEYFTLPADLVRSEVIEISRFAIVAAHRKTRTFLPIVSLGLFKLCHDFARFLGVEREIVCSKAEKMWTYQAMAFQPTGIVTRYEKLNGAAHELLWHDFRESDTMLAGNPFHELFLERTLDEVTVPCDLPPVGLVDELIDDEPLAVEPLRLAVGA